MSTNPSITRPVVSDFCGPFGEHLLQQFDAAATIENRAEDELKAVEATYKELKRKHREAAHAATEAFQLFKKTAGAEAYLEANRKYVDERYLSKSA